MLTDVIEIQKQNCDIQDFTTNVEEGNGEGIKVVPNPALDYVDIFVESLWQQDLPFVVKSSFGQILKTGIIPAGQSVTSLPLDLPGGIYQIAVNTPSGPLTRKVLFLHH